MTTRLTPQTSTRVEDGHVKTEVRIEEGLVLKDTLTTAGLEEQRFLTGRLLDRKVLQTCDWANPIA